MKNRNIIFLLFALLVVGHSVANAQQFSRGSGVSLSGWSLWFGEGSSTNPVEVDYGLGDSDELLSVARRIPAYFKTTVEELGAGSNGVPSQILVSHGQSLSLEVETGGDPESTVVWSFRGEQFSGNTLTVDSVRFTDGQITAIASNVYGSETIYMTLIVDLSEYEYDTTVAVEDFQFGLDSTWLWQQEEVPLGYDGAWCSSGPSGSYADDPDPLVLDLSGPGTLSFMWKSDGAPLNVLSGSSGSEQEFYPTGDWDEVTFDIVTYGDHQVEFITNLYDSEELGYVAAVNWEPRRYGLDLLPSEGGDILADPEGPVYPYGAVVTLTAVPDEGYEFFGWSGDFLEEAGNSGSVTMTGNRFVRAEFGLIGSSLQSLSSDGLELTTGGDVEWYMQSEHTTGSAPYAARSGAISDGEQSWIETTVEGPGEVRFWMKASSEQYEDYLWFYVDGSYESALSGDADWEEQSHTIGAGSHTLRWTYRKDEAGADGLDAGFLSDIRYIPDTSPKTLEVSSSSGGSLEVSPIKATYDYGEIITISAIPDEGYEFGGWSGALSGSEMVVEFSIVADLTISAIFHPALDAAGFAIGITDFQRGGDALWYIQNEIVPDGIINAIRSGGIVDDGVSWIEATVEGPGNLSFMRKISSEDGYDYLTFYMDGQDIDDWSGESDWTEAIYALDAGTHILRWEYEKDGSVSEGFDSSFLANIRYVSESSFEAWIASLELPPGQDGPDDRNGPLGLQNLLAYGLGLNPFDASVSDLPTINFSNADNFEYVHFLYRKRTNDPTLIFTIRSSENLVNWGEAGVVSDTQIDSGADWEVRDASIAIPEAGKLFLRLDVDLE